MRKIANFEGQANKVKGDGDVLFDLWIDNDGRLYVQITGTTGGYKKPGTHSNLAYLVSKYIDKSPIIGDLEGVDPISGKPDISQDNDVPGFLRAALENMFPPGKVSTDILKKLAPGQD